MLIVLIILAGLALGSFVNALVWRLKKQEELAEKKHKAPSLSVLKGRSMCPKCEHKLAAKDLLPVFSWLFLKRKCRYCKKTISWQYPLVELLTASFFALSYIFWPGDLSVNWQLAAFISWLAMMVGLMAMAVYDIKWMILPDKIVFPLYALAIVTLAVELLLGLPVGELLGVAIAVAIGGGIFWLIYQVSHGKWIGGGDVKLGFLLGLIVAKPEYAFLLIFMASILAIIFTAPLLAAKKLKKDSKVPFGPFLIAACFLVVILGPNILDAYKSIFGL